MTGLRQLMEQGLSLLTQGRSIPFHQNAHGVPVSVMQQGQTLPILFGPAQQGLGGAMVRVSHGIGQGLANNLAQAAQEFGMLRFQDLPRGPPTLAQQGGGQTVQGGDPQHFRFPAGAAPEGLGAGGRGRPFRQGRPFPAPQGRGMQDLLFGLPQSGTQGLRLEPGAESLASASLKGLEGLRPGPEIQGRQQVQGPQ